MKLGHRAPTRRGLTLAIGLSVSGCASNGASTTTGASDASTGDPGTTAGTAGTIALSGTSGDSTGPGATSSAAPDDTGTGGESCPAPPDPAPAWLFTYQEQIVAELSGAAELEPGVTLPDRATPQRRASAATYLATRLEELGLEPQLHDYGEGTNVHAVLPATDDSEQYMVVGAHYDTVPDSPGANDNATGVALVLALARHLQALPCRSLNTIFVMFDQEEIGLVGSYAYARLLDEQALDVVAVHTIDQMGWDADGDRAVELERADAGLFELYDDASVDLEPPVPLTPTQTGFTDHVSFREWGFAAVGLTEEFVSGDTTPHYHLPTDTYDTVSFDYLASTTVLANATFARRLVPGP